MLTSEFKTALTYLDAGRAAEALPILSRIVERWPNYAAAQVAYAQALQQEGDAGASFEAWSRAESLVSRSAVVQAGLLEAAAQLFGDVGLSADRTVSPVEESDGAVDGAIHEAVPETGFDGPAGAAAEDVAAAESQVSESLVEESAPDQEPFTDESELSEDDMSQDVVSEDERQVDDLPEYADAAAMDPALFVPVAVPTDPSVVEESDRPEWVDGPSSAEPAEMPEWEGGYEGSSEDGADADIDIDPEQPEDDVELDRLIGELETARIIPAEDPSSVPAPDLSDDIDDVVSETLAQIYATQKQFSEAARLYDRLALDNPDRAEEFASKASEMRGRAQ